MELDQVEIRTCGRDILNFESSSVMVDNLIVQRALAERIEATAK